MGELSDGLFDEIRQRMVTLCTQALLAKGNGVPWEAEHALPQTVVSIFNTEPWVPVFCPQEKLCVYTFLAQVDEQANHSKGNLSSQITFEKLLSLTGDEKKFKLKPQLEAISYFSEWQKLTSLIKPNAGKMWTADPSMHWWWKWQLQQSLWSNSTAASKFENVRVLWPNNSSYSGQILAQEEKYKYVHCSIICNYKSQWWIKCSSTKE